MYACSSSPSRKSCFCCRTIPYCRQTRGIALKNRRALRGPKDMPDTLPRWTRLVEHRSKCLARDETPILFWINYMQANRTLLHPRMFERVGRSAKHTHPLPGKIILPPHLLPAGSVSEEVLSGKNVTCAKAGMLRAAQTVPGCLH